MGFLDEIDEVGVGAKPRVNLVKVNDVVASVKPSRLKYGVEPKRIYTKTFDIVQLGCDTGKVAYAVAVGIHVR